MEAIWSLKTVEMKKSQFSCKIKLFTEEKVMGAKPELSRRETIGATEKGSPGKYQEESRGGRIEKL